MIRENGKQGGKGKWENIYQEDFRKLFCWSTLLGIFIVFLFFMPLLMAEDDFNTIRKKAIEPYKGYHIYRGDLHVHTNFSADARRDQTIESVIKSARERLDFVAITDHDENLNDVLTKDEWNQIVSVCENENRDGKFVVIPGYEWTYPDQHFMPNVKDYEHKIIYFDNPPKDIFRFHKYETPQKLADAVRIAEGLGHTAHPRSFTVIDLENSRIVVSHHERDNWNSGPLFNTIFPNTEIYPDGPLCSYDFDKRAADDIKDEQVQISWELEIQKALSMGHRLGFIATSDTHMPIIKPGKDRRTVVFAKGLTRKDILDALKQRHNYAEVTPDNIDIYFSILGHIIGDEFETNKKPELLLNIQSTSEISAVYVYKNNSKWIDINNRNSSSLFSSNLKEVNYMVEDDSFTELSFYVVKIKLKGFDEYGFPYTVWTSPIWVNKANQ